MDVFDAIEQRRSIKKFDPAHAMTEDEIQRLFGAVIRSPTSFNIQNWRFVVVTDPERKAALRLAGFGQSQFTDASLIAVLCGDLQAHARSPERYWASCAPAVRDAVVPMIGRFYGGNPGLQHDEALRSCGIAAQTLMLAAKAMGYDTCPMVGFDFARAAEIINLPADHEIVLAVAVGKALEAARPRSGQLPLDEVVVREAFA